jgi:hypothetical protein
MAQSLSSVLYHYFILMADINLFCSPADGLANPFYLISNNTEDQENLKRAELDPTPVVMSDWAHLTSGQLHNVAVSANIDTL